jgi:hypothetical protein
MLKTKISTGILSLVLLTAAGSASADVIALIQFSNGTFDDNGTFSGSLTSDQTTFVSTWDVTTTMGTTRVGYDYTNSAPHQGVISGGPNAIEFEYILNSIGNGLQLYVTPVSLNTGTVSGNEFDITCSGICLDSNFRNITGGIVTFTLTTTGGVPEPAVWSLLLTGFAGLGATLRDARRTRTAAAA